jgi:hypothetical protein
VSPPEATVALLAIAAACSLSAAAGLGGSLVLVPVLAVLIGVKEGVALAALVLAANNVVKLVAYRRTLAARPAIGIALLTMVGSAAGAVALVAAPERLVQLGVVLAVVASLVAERRGRARRRPVATPALALAAGAASGFSGTSGPLKGVAVRSLGLDREHTAGAATLVSLAGDIVKAAVFAEASLLGPDQVTLALAAIPLMVLGTAGGRILNRRMGEQGYAVLFWAVMGGYVVRVFVR